MKPMKRILAMLLAALMLCGMSSAVAEVEVALEGAQDALEVDLSQDGLDIVLDLSDEAGLVEEAPEAAVVANATEPDAKADPFVINKNGVLVSYNGSAAKVTVPDSVRVIGTSAFEGNATMTSVTLPVGVTTIRGKAFAKCPELATVNILASDVTIVGTAFKGSNPTICTPVGAKVAVWARRHGLDVQANLVVLTQNTSLKAAIGDTYRIYLVGETASSYTSTNTAVATVTQGGVVSVVGGGTAQIMVTLPSGLSRVLSLTVAYPKASLSKKSLHLNAGESQTLTVSDLSGRTVSWTSSNISVATVQGGRVTALREGKCDITANLSDGTALTCKVTVKDNAKLSHSSLTLKVGHSHTLTVSGLAGRAVSWSSSNSGIATVSGGKVTGVKGGTCTITAQVQNGKALKCKVTVKDNAKLNRTSVSLKVGQSYTLKVKHTGGRSVSWTSSNTSVATVSGGKVSAHKAGSCTVTARLSDGKTLTCKVSVTGEPSKAKLNKTTLEMKAGATYRLTVSNLGSSTVTWVSSDIRVALVDKNGLITAIRPGQCVITARLSNGTSLDCKLTVLNR